MSPAQQCSVYLSIISLTHTRTRAPLSLPSPPPPSPNHPGLGVGATWILHSFWHICYFVILITVALIWKPSSVSDQLSYSFQLATSEEEADSIDKFDNIDGIASDEDDGDEVEIVEFEEHSVDKDLS